MTAPNNLEAERALLGAALLDPDAAAIASALTPDCWYSPAHGVVAGAIASLDDKGLEVNAVSVAEYLAVNRQLNAAGGHQGLLDITADVSVTNPKAISQLADTLRSYARDRRYMAAGLEAARAAEQRDQEGAERALESALDVHDESGLVAIEDMATDHLALLEARAAGKIPGIPTGMASLDEYLINLRLGELYVLAARPAVGKTTWVCQLALNLAAAGNRVMFCSLEMSQPELMDKFVANLGRVDSTHLTRPAPHDMAKAEQAIAALKHLPIDVIDASTQTVASIRGHARARKPEVIIVDYLQLVTAPGRSRQEEIASIARGLKVLARSLNCVVVACSQLSRNVEQRVNKRPTLPDLRESGEIEQAAGVCLGLYRESVYDVNADDSDLECIILKNRHGPNGTAHLVVSLPWSMVTGGEPKVHRRDTSRIDQIWDLMAERTLEKAREQGQEIGHGFKERAWVKAVRNNLEKDFRDQANEYWREHPNQEVDYYIFKLDPTLSRRDWSIPLPVELAG